MEFTDKQIEAIHFYKGCCNVIASAGSGKTKVLVNRIANLINEYGVKPENILAVTFNKKAQENMVNRLKEILPSLYDKVNIETFHSFGYKIVKMFSEKQYTLILDRDKRDIIRNIFKEQYWDEGDYGERITYKLELISSKKNQLILPSDEEDQNEVVYNLYEEQKELKYKIDFDDMLFKCYYILKNNKDALKYCQEKFQFILADEMQDTNKAQYEIIKLIGQKNRNIFIVDDPLQNIYEWRGSSNDYVLKFHEDWKDTKIIHLNKNFRSTKNIIDMANRFALSVPEANNPNYVESISNGEEFMNPIYDVYKDEYDEAKNIADKINEYISAELYSFKDFAVLARTNAQLQTYESVFRNNNIPYGIVEGQPFIEKAEVKLILNYLKLVENMNDDTAFEYIYNKPNRYLGNAFITETKQKAKQLKMSLYFAMFKTNLRFSKSQKAIDEICNVINTLKDNNYSNVGNQIKYLRKRLNIDDYVSNGATDDNNKNDKVEVLDSLQRMASNYAKLSDFLEYIKGFDGKKDDVFDSVRLSTVHKAKGLEFKVVFLIGMNEGLFPHHLNCNYNEEQRLNYVAITRAMKELYVSSTKSYGNDSKCHRSSFIPVMFPEVMKQEMEDEKKKIKAKKKKKKNHKK